MKPEMIVIAGPSGSGKSRHFAARSFGVAFFNVDDRCAELNGGSYHETPVEARLQAQRECEQFIADRTAQGESFAVETTLRSPIAIDQAARAKVAGFAIKMIFVSTDDVQTNIDRIVRRGLDGGHSAPTERIVEIYQRSLTNLRRAIVVFDNVLLYDSSAYDQPARLVRVYEAQRIAYNYPPTPAWLANAVGRG